MIEQSSIKVDRGFEAVENDSRESEKQRMLLQIRQLKSWWHCFLKRFHKSKVCETKKTGHKMVWPEAVHKRLPGLRERKQSTLYCTL